MNQTREIELRQWWQALGVALQRQSFAPLDLLRMSPGKVRDAIEQLHHGKPGWKQWEVFMAAIFEVGEDVFVKLAREKYMNQTEQAINITASESQPGSTIAAMGKAIMSLQQQAAGQAKRIKQLETAAREQYDRIGRLETALGPWLEEMAAIMSGRDIPSTPE